MNQDKRPNIRHHRHPLMNCLSMEQRRSLKAIVSTYTPDLHDPAAVEVLLILREVCYILDMLPHDMDRLFTRRVLAALDAWGDLITRPQRPQRLRRAWVWLPNQAGPQCFPVAPDGTIHIYPQGNES